jgi:hypothetical protein
MAVPMTSSSASGNSSSGGGGVSPIYDIDFTIDDFDLKMNLVSIRILGSIWSIYHTFLIKIRLDYLEVIENDIYGQKDCKLVIKETTEDKETLEEHEIDLVILKSYSSGMPKRTNEAEREKHHALQDVHLYVCVPKKPYENMTQIVNYLAQDTDAKSPYDAADALINKYLSGSQINVLDKNKNDKKLYQFPIPPQEFCSAIDYLNSKHSIYKGPIFYANWFMDDTFCMWDLSKKIEENEEFKIYVLARGDDGEIDIMQEVGSDDEVFYTYNTLGINNNSGNLPAIKSSFENVYVTKPDDGLYTIEKKKFEDVFDENSPKTGSETFIHESVKKSKRVWTRPFMAGTDNYEALATSSSSLNMINGSEITFGISGNLRLKNLFKYGSVIDLETEVADYTDYQGKYILQTSYLTLVKTRSNYTAVAMFSGIRSNIKHGGSSAGGGV